MPKTRNNKSNDSKNNKSNKKLPATRGLFIFSLLVLALLGLLKWWPSKETIQEIDYSLFKQKITTGEITTVKITDSALYGKAEAFDNVKNTYHTLLNQKNTSEQPTTYKTIALNDPLLLPLLDHYGITYYGAIKPNYDLWLNFAILAVLIFVFFIIPRIVLNRKIASMNEEGPINPNPMLMGQSRAKVVPETELKTRFSDIAGCDESKEELAEIVDFLRNPQLYTEIGGKIPSGALLVGPPGTGKTLLARAVAGEAGVTFFKMSGADFVEMYVGVGASRVRDLFKLARDKSPAIVFIDEIDAIGKSRANNLNSNDEREQTLNQLLVEMDGFDATTGVIVLAATNRPEILDPALLRAGRFDRQIMVDRPDINGRYEILKIHTKNVKLNNNVNLKQVAIATPGLVGSDLANIVNEAALFAVRNKRKLVYQEDFNEAIEKAVIGLAKRTRVMSRFEKENTAYHEVGHALINVFTADADPLRKVSVVPRGMALGVTWSSPIEGRYSKTYEELIAMIDITLGGRAAEQVIYNRISTGAANDINQATEIARSMIMDFGMSDRFMNVSFRKNNNFLTGYNLSNCSDNTQKYIDDEIAQLIKERYEHALNLLTKHKDLLLEIGQIILKTETLSREEFLSYVQKNPAGQAELDLVKEQSLDVSQLELSNFVKNEPET